MARTNNMSMTATRYFDDTPTFGEVRDYLNELAEQGVPYDASSLTKTGGFWSPHHLIVKWERKENE